MMISTKPLPGHLHIPISFREFRLKCISTYKHEIPSSINDFPLQQRFYTREAVFWKEAQGELYMFKLSPREVGRIRWAEREDGVIIDLENGSTPVEVEPVSELELLFLFS
jgi:hypothetical protein